MIKVGILTISDLGSQGRREDTSGQALKEMVRASGWQVAQTEIVPDEKALISEKLRLWSDREKLQLILTTGGTGFAERDITPEATAEVLEKQAPGLAEAMRAAGMSKTPHAMLSRGIAGIRGQSLIVNLPGSKKGSTESLEAIMPALPHAIDVLIGNPGH